MHSKFEQVIAVSGSIDMDFVTLVLHLPQPGEAVLRNRFDRFLGGKGASQATAAARLGWRVGFYGRVGVDSLGKELLDGLKKNGIDANAVEREEGIPYGIANVWVNPEGENMIAYVPGANARVDRAYISRVLPLLTAAKILLLQFETLVTMIASLLESLPKSQPFVILNPAPAQNISSLLLTRVDLITPNRGELAALTREATIEQGARCLLDQGVKEVLGKVGKDGAYWATNRGIFHFPAPRSVRSMLPVPVTLLTPPWPRRLLKDKHWKMRWEGRTWSELYPPSSAVFNLRFPRGMRWNGSWRKGV